MKNHLTIIGIILLLCISYSSHAQQPYKSGLEGTYTLNGIVVGDCKVNSLTLGYRLSTIVGQPAVYSIIKWIGQNSASTCLSDAKFEIFLSIGSGGIGRYIHAGGSYGMIVGPGDNTWGNNPLAGSPSWDKLISKNASSGDDIEYFSADEAKKIWQDGFSVVDVKIIALKNGSLLYEKLQNQKIEEYKNSLEELKKRHEDLMASSTGLVEVDRSGIEKIHKDYKTKETEISNMLNAAWVNSALSNTEIYTIENNVSLLKGLNDDLGEDIDVLKVQDAAKTKAKNEQATTTASNGHIETDQEREDRYRRERLEEIKMKDKEEVLTGAAIDASVTGVLLDENLNNKKITGRTTYFKAGVNVAAYNIPAIENVTDQHSLHYSSLSNQMNYGGQVQLDAWIYNNNKFGFLLQPIFYYGVNLSSGSNGTQLIYGGNARIQYGRRVKIFAEGGSFERAGEEIRDWDAIAGSYSAGTTSGAIGSVSYIYETYRYGGGLIFGPGKIALKDRDIGLKLAVYIDNPTNRDYDNQIKTPLFYQLQWTMDGGIFIGAEYSMGYPYANEAIYSIDEAKKGSYFSFQFGKTFNLTPSR